MSEYISKDDINRALLERIRANETCVINAINLRYDESEHYFKNLIFEDGQILSIINELPFIDM